MRPGSSDKRPLYVSKGEASVVITPPLALEIIQTVSTALGQADPLAGIRGRCLLVPGSLHGGGPITPMGDTHSYRLYTLPSGHQVGLHRLLCYMRYGPPAGSTWTADRAHLVVAMHSCSRPRCDVACSDTAVILG